MKKEYKKTRAFIYLLITIISFFLPGMIVYFVNPPLAYGVYRRYKEMDYIISYSLFIIPYIYLFFKNILFFIKTIKNKNYLYSFIMLLSIVIMLLAIISGVNQISKNREIIDDMLPQLPV